MESQVTAQLEAMFGGDPPAVVSDSGSAAGHLVELARPSGLAEDIGKVTHADLGGDSLGGVIALLESGDDARRVEILECLVANRGRRLGRDAISPGSRVDPPADLHGAFLDVESGGPQLVHGGDAQEVTVLPAEYRTRSEAMVVPVPNIRLMPPDNAFLPPG